MSIWRKIIRFREGAAQGIVPDKAGSASDESFPRYAFIDVETSRRDGRVQDIGALRYDGAVYHGTSRAELMRFLHDVDYICGHNILRHDVRHLFPDVACPWIVVDTLDVSPLLFPERPYHRLVKDDKLVNDQMNNPATMTCGAHQCVSQSPGNPRTLLKRNPKQQFFSPTCC